MDEQEDSPTVGIIRPTADEVSKGYRNLQMCWPTWKQTPGLLVDSDNELALIVSAVDYTHDDLGFVLHFAIQEKILAVSELSDDKYSVGFDWNQPYLSFNHDKISAPYACYLHFEEAGVERARELSKALGDNLLSPRSLRRCFGRHGAEYFTDMMSRLKE